MLDLSPNQIAILERCIAAGFTVAAFPLYESAVGVKKGNCAALLVQKAADRMAVLGEVCYLVDGNLSVRVRRKGADLFVWKRKELEVTDARLAELAQFRRDLDLMLVSGE